MVESHQLYKPLQEPSEWFSPFLTCIQILSTYVGQLQAERATRAEQGVRGYAPISQPLQLPLVQEVKVEQTLLLTPISQGDWIKCLDKFMTSKPQIFQYEVDILTTIYQNKGVRRHALSLGTGKVQLQRIVTFTLQDYIGKWRVSFCLDEKKLTAT